MIQKVLSLLFSAIKFWGSKIDIDIDFKTTFSPTSLFDGIVVASMKKVTSVGPDLVKHPCGHYFQSIPKDPVTNLSAIPFKEAEELGYFKIDMLHLSLLDSFQSKDQIRKMMRQEPDWTLLEDPDIVASLFQLGKHFDMVHKVKPKSVEQLADCLALVRPNKRMLLSNYLRNPDKVRPQLYRLSDDEDKSSFRRSHAIAYSFNIVLQLHTIKQTLVNNDIQ